MAVIVRLPKMSDTMEEGVLVSWQVKVGDKLQPGDVLAEVETDKATMDLENYEKGTVLHLVAEEGATIPIDSVIAVMGKEGEDYKADLDKALAAAQSSNNTAEEETTAAPEQEEHSAPTASAPATATTPSNDSNGRIKASPLAKKMAEEKGIDLQMVAGSGDHGRIVKKDIENFKAPAATATPAIAGQESFEEIPVSQMRKTIARRLGESKFTAPHFYLTIEVNMDRAIEARKRFKEFTEARISVNDIIIKAASVALRKHPMVNASWRGDKIRINHHIHMGVAIAVEEGLLVPVVRFSDQKSLTQISSEVKDYAQKAKDKKLQPNDYEGNTFTISNLGMFGIEEFTAIINSPDSCIMAVGAAKETVVVENGEFKTAHMMKVTLSCDHRVVDGAKGAEFLQTFKTLLEDPVKILV